MTTLGKRKEGPAEEDNTTTPKSQEKASAQPDSAPKNPVMSKPAP